MVAIGRRMTRAIIYGFAFLIIGFIAMNILCTAVNIIAAPVTVFHPIGIPLLVGGLLLLLSLGIELSSDIGSTESKKPT